MLIVAFFVGILLTFRGNNYIINTANKTRGKDMIKRIVLKQDDLYSTAGIVFYIFELLKYDTNEFNTVNDILSDKKTVAKFFKEHNIEPAKKIDRTYFYTEEDLKLLVGDKDMMKHFKSRKENLIKYKNLEAYKKQSEQSRKARASAHTDVDYTEVGLTHKDVDLIEADKYSGGDLLNIEELKFLGKKGFVHKSDLSIKEKRDLEIFNNTLSRIESEDTEIDKLFRAKKLEIMITKIFERICPDLDVDEKLLKDDIDLLVRGGLYQTETQGLFEHDTSAPKAEEQTIEKSRRRIETANFADNYIIEKE